MIPLINLKKQFISIQEEILADISQVIESGSYILGPKGEELEKQIAARVGTTEAIAVANGTDALVLTLEALGIGEGDEVITSPFTFFATAEAITRTGATPVFVDVDSATFNIKADTIADKITPATKAIIPVHLFGQPADMDAIMTTASKHGLKVIEDACQAFGAQYKEREVGGIGDAACFSFFPTKNLGTIGDGGIITTSDEALASEIRKLRVHGSNSKYYHEKSGYNSRLDEIHAAILLICLKYIDQWNSQRRLAASRYDNQLAQLKGIETPFKKADRMHTYHLYSLKVHNRDKAVSYLANAQIGSGVYYPCCLHLQEAYQDLGYQQGDFPIAEQLSESLLAIPMHPFLTEEEQNEVIAAIKGMDDIL
ncbi:DegT/DnrJ/EryC1/StrS family aminotransferase [Sediminibacillus albus]|uniref:dTDP-4-amino-4,6-dideoxygalactose transaminase n=1 Tax=Sediminibacillus albus TaxID=407036 RepID=A0A1G9CCW5_9BACI|nr:DegT/DnrJ/EryC1/StrS family aminotransferase [Sediminibacillus albus]SDK49528.1 dTDP-4-amino-4,6-dideoxygalactose transaminase [Sediminibacillus albus]